MSRNVFDLSHFVFSAFQIGRLQTLSVVPNLAGDSFSINYNGLFRLAALRRQLSMDALIDLFAFWIPHRHHYGDTWVKYIKAGMLGGVTLPPRANIPFNMNCLAVHNMKGVYPKWRVDGYNMIYNRYFKNPQGPDRDVFVSETGGKPGNQQREYGLTSCHLKRMWNTCLYGEPEFLKAENVPVTTTTETGSSFDIWDLEKAKATYNNIAQREWFTVRYNDIMKRTWGAGVNIDADQRPALLRRTSTFMSGYDVDGTGGDSLGMYGGKAYCDVSLKVPRTFLPEHGAVWFMALIRFPPVHEQERHYLTKIPSPSYPEFTADPRVVPAMKPKEMRQLDYFDTNDDDPYGYQPYASWYREHPNVVHVDYDNLNGFPFLSLIPDADSAHYINPGDYNEVFQSPKQLGHAHCQSHMGLKIHRVLPEAVSGLFISN